MSVKKRIKPIIFGIKGLKLNDKEKKLFIKSNPLGFILFERNCKNINQLKKLINELKKITDHNHTMIMIDQEGGRVSRLKEPNWKTFPSSQYFGKKAEHNLDLAKKLVFNNAKKISKDLKKLGINMNCAPVLDVLYDFTNKIIGDRSFSFDPNIVSELSKEYCNGLKINNVLPIIKHIPGHGASKFDTHLVTSKVNLSLSELEKKDFIPFKKLNKEKAAMISHIIYTKIDSKAACESKKIVNKIIRKKIGFKGLLFSDDINMKALKGSLKNKVRSILSSGCEVILHCNGNIDQMNKIQSVIPFMKSNVLKKISRINYLK
tara:strand:- start:17835 stop:18791 length:957 start_codon:yes stop_codon:yes gene_type:complete